MVNQVKHVGSDEAISIGELACLVRDIVSPNMAVRFLGTTVDKGSKSWYVTDIVRVRSELGFKVTIPLNQAIQSFVNSIRL